MKNSKTKTNLFCQSCDKPISDHDTHYLSTDGDVMCEECGDNKLFIHSFTTYDEYPYIRHLLFDGGQYLGDPYKKIEP